MMKTTTINKKFIIKTEDAFGEKTFEIVKGSYEVNSLSNYRKYSYVSRYGNCEIIFLNKVLNIIRKGRFNSIFEISFDGKINKFLYETDMLREEFYTLGEEIFFDEIKKIFSFTYRLFDLKNSEVNRISFSIKEI